MTTSNQHTRYIEVNKGYATIRLDEVGADTLVTVYNVNVKDIDLLIEKLQAVKAEHVKPSVVNENGYGLKWDEVNKTVVSTIINRTAQGFSPRAIAYQINKELKK